MGAWRHYVARMRAEVLHRGRRPTAVDADEVVAALRMLERHVADRVAHRSTTYPWTAYVHVGRQGLERRGRLAAVMETLAGAATTPEGWIADYVRWLDGVLGRDDVEES